MKTNEKRTKILAMMLFALMTVSGFAVLGDNDTAEAAVGDGGSYSYTITYNPSAMSSTSAAISTANMTAISHTGTPTTLSSMNEGSWTWNSTTGLGPFNSFYGAFDIQNGNRFYAVLNPYDLTETIDGENLPTPLTRWNIMWVLPTVYISSTATTFTLSNDSSSGTAYAHTIDGHVYKYIAIGVYEGSTQTLSGNTILTSTTGTTPTANATRPVFRGYAHNYSMDSSLNESSSYPAYSMLWNYDMWQLYKSCCFALMEDFNSQNHVGNGHVFTNNSVYTYQTGSLDTSGPYVGTPAIITDDTTASSYGSDSVKLFIEDAWGGKWDFIDGAVLSNVGIYLDSSNNPTDSHTGTYITYKAWATPLQSGWPTSIQTDSARVWNTQGSTVGGNYPVGTADAIWIGESTDRVLIVGGAIQTGWVNSNAAGISQINGFNSLSDNYNDNCSRLAFVFDSGLPVTVDIEANYNSYGTVDVSQLRNVPNGSTVTVNGNQITINNQTVTATPTADTAEYDYEFVSWSVTNGQTITSDMTITANFSREVKQYTVSVAVNNPSLGSVDESSVTVPYGTAISTNGNLLTIGSTTVTATPETADAQYTYSFSAWTGTTATVTGTMTITANFTATVNNYTVSIGVSPSGYGSVSTSSFNVPYGTVISAAANVLTVGTGSSTATAATQTAQYTYAFDSWSGIPLGGEIVGDTTVTANFTATLRSYTVSIAPNDNSYGSVSQSTVTSVPYGSTVSVNGATIGVYNSVITAEAETATVQYAYAFSGWSVANGYTIVGDTSITANFTRTVQQYTVSIVSNDLTMGTVVPVGSISGVDYDSLITISGNQMEINGTVVTATAAEATVYYTYNFDDWSVSDGDRVTGNMTITANFTSSVTTFIVLITPNNSNYGSVTVDEISGATYGMVIEVNGDTISVNDVSSQAIPASQDAQYTYAFDSWSVTNGQTVSGDMTITANFTASVRNYTVTVQADSTGYGSVIPATTVTAPYGTHVQVNGDTINVNGRYYTAAPIAQTAQYTYRFVSWSVSDNAEITGDTTITASFERVTRNYTVSFAPNDSSYGSVAPDTVQNVPYGTLFTVNDNVITLLGQDVTATAATQTAQYTYAFSGWSVTGSTQVTGDMTVTATFVPTLRNYTVSIVPNDANYGSVSPLSVLNVPYGTVISATDNTLDVNGTTVTATYEEADAQYTYAFGSWSIGQEATLQGDMSITAVFTATVNTYTVTVDVNVPYRGTVSPSSVLNVPYGTVISATDNTLDVNGTTVTATPRSPEQQWSYVFDSWTPMTTSGVPVTGNTTITANFERELTKYTVTIVPNDPTRGTLSQSTVTEVPYGTSIYSTGNVLTVGTTTITATYSSPDVQYTYGWNNYTGIPMSYEVRTNLTITANFSATLNDYTITWSIDGTETTQEYPYGTMPSHAEPTKENYVFIGWDPELEPVTGDQTYEAVFIVAVPVTVSFDAWTNDGILIGDSSKVVYVGAKYGTLPTATRANHNFNGWWTQYDGGTEITATSIVSIDENTTLYARFVPNAAYEQVLPMLDMIPLIAIASLIMIIVGGIFYYRTH